MLAMTADLLEGFGVRGLKERSGPRAGKGGGYRKYRTSRSHVP
jgi:hypothetical protein